MRAYPRCRSGPAPELAPGWYASTPSAWLRAGDFEAGMGGANWRRSGRLRRSSSWWEGSPGRDAGRRRAIFLRPSSAAWTRNRPWAGKAGSTGSFVLRDGLEAWFRAGMGGMHALGGRGRRPVSSSLDGNCGRRRGARWEPVGSPRGRGERRPRAGALPGWGHARVARSLVESGVMAPGWPPFGGAHRHEREGEPALRNRPYCSAGNDSTPILELSELRENVPFLRQVNLLASAHRRPSLAQPVPFRWRPARTELTFP